jgi:hypothetical protein
MGEKMIKAAQEAHNFLFRFSSDNGIHEWWEIKSTRPKIKLPTKEIQLFTPSDFTDIGYVNGKIFITLRDFSGISLIKAVMKWAILHREAMMNGKIYKRNCELEMREQTGNVVHKWILSGCMLTSDIDFGELDFDPDECAEISFDIQSDYCISVY